MVIEYIKRNQKMGYEDDKLVYKVYLDEQSPITPDITVPAPVKTDAVTETTTQEESIPSIEPELMPEL
jgi:hypothetical protein